MKNTLTREELNQIIREVQSLELRQESEFDREQIQEILRELNLPPQLLDEALIALHSRQRLEVKKRRSKWIVMGTISVVSVIVLAIGFFNQKQANLLTKVSVQQDKIILSSQSDAKNVTTEKILPKDAINPQSNSEILYVVTLKDAPLGRKLSMSCNWINPQGEIVKQNNYQTREIKTSVWETRCRYSVDTDVSTGNWQVEMFLENREISQEQFVIK